MPHAHGLRRHYHEQEKSIKRTNMGNQTMMDCNPEQVDGVRIEGFQPSKVFRGRESERPNLVSAGNLQTLTIIWENRKNALETLIGSRLLRDT